MKKLPALHHCLRFDRECAQCIGKAIVEAVRKASAGLVKRR